jgi:hypothetical protein
MRNGQASRLHASETRPDGALLPHLMGLNHVELAKADSALDNDGA